MTVEEGVDWAVSKVGLWWPLAEQVQLSRVSAAYRRVGAAALAAAGAGSREATLVTSNGRGVDVDAFAAHWAAFDSGGEGGLLRPPRGPRRRSPTGWTSTPPK